MANDSEEIVTVAVQVDTITDVKSLRIGGFDA